MRFDREEGQILPQEPMFLYGRNLYENTVNGWYIVVRLHFFRKLRKYVNPISFEIDEKVCFPVFLLMRRKPYGMTNFRWINLTTWFPV